MNHDLFSQASHWIWMEGAADVNCYLQFREIFRTEGEEPVQLYLSAEGQYAVFADGNYMPSTQYPDFPQGKSVQKIQIPGSERETHTLEIQVWYSGADTSVTRKEQPGLRYELRQGDRVLAASGEETDVRPLSGYQSGPIANITGQLGVGFAWANRLPEPWQKAVAVDKPCTFVARPIPELQVGALTAGRLYSQGIFTAHESGLQQFAALSYRERQQLSRNGEETLC